MISTRSAATDSAQNFAGGKIFYSPATGANVVEADILAKYESLGGPGGDLGFPIANEADGGLEPASRISTFSAADKPVIFWTPDHGAFVVRGAMNAAWDKLGGATGELGAPMADQTEQRDVVTQKFTGGEISWNKTKNTFTHRAGEPGVGAVRSAGAGTEDAAGAASPGGEARMADLALVVVAGRCAGCAAGAGGVGVALACGVARVRVDAVPTRRDAGSNRRLGRVRLRAAPPSLSRSGRRTTMPNWRRRACPTSTAGATTRRTVRLPTSAGSEWMPPSRKSLVDELLEDEPRVPTSYPVSPISSRDVHEDLPTSHEDLAR